MVATPPPSKREQMQKLLERGSVFIHLDPRRDGVTVPPWLAKQPQLVLQIGLNFPVPIHDLQIDDEGVRCTLSFNRTPHLCVLPWGAVYALVAEDGQSTVWPSEIPRELVPRPEPATARKTPTRSKRDSQEPAPRRREGAAARISVVPPPPDLAPTSRDDGNTRPTPVAPMSPLRTDDADAAPRTPSRPPPSPGGGRKPRELPPYLRVVK